MTKIQLEELEPRHLLSNVSLSPGISLSPPSLTETGNPSALGHASLVQPGPGGGAMGQTQLPVQNPSFTDNRGNDGQPAYLPDVRPASLAVLANFALEQLSSLERWYGSNAFSAQPSLFAAARVAGDMTFWSITLSPGLVIFDAVPISIEVTTNFSSPNFGVERLASPGPGNVVNAAPAERVQSTFVAAAANTPSGSDMGMMAPVVDFSAQAARASVGPLPVVTVGVGVGAIYPANGTQPPSVPPALGHSSSSEPAGFGGTLVQGLLIAPPPAAGRAIPSLLAESRVIGQHALLPRILPLLELEPQGQQESVLPQLNWSPLTAGLSQFLSVFGPQGQQALPLPPPDLAALEAGLLQFLTDLSETGSQLLVSPDRAALRMWLFAAVGAGAACAIGYRQQRRSAERYDEVIPHLPGCSLDDVF